VVPAWVRELLEILLQHGMVDLGFEAATISPDRPARCRVGWLAQQLHSTACGHIRTRTGRTLDSETLTRDLRDMWRKGGRPISALSEQEPAD
jgi:hypothetical protein